MYESPRFTALELLVQVSEKQAYSNLLVNDSIKKHKLSVKDAGLMTEIVYGTIGRRMTLEYYLAPFISKTKKVDNWVKQLLLLSLYQMEYLDKVPEYSIFNDAVEIAKVKGNVGIGKFVNGVLRTIQRTGIRPTSEIKDDMERLSVEASMPIWLVEKLVSDIGYDETQVLGQSLLEPSRVSGRVMTNQMPVSEVVERLSYEGIKARQSMVSDCGVVAEKGFLAGSEVFKEGMMTIQDESSMLVAPSMQIEPQHHVLDACAAPGGKTTHIATYLDASKGGVVTALDIHKHKLKLVQENADRLGVSDVVKPLLMDARQVESDYEDNSFDRILIDAPCSGLGLLRRKPDIKYSKKPEDFMNLQKIQLEILESVITKVKVWGIITYSTCTITSEENRHVIETFLDRHPNFELIDLEVGMKVPKSYENKMLQLYPHQYQTDGFFISCLRRKA